MWIDIASQALRAGKVLELRYDGYSRCLEVHAVGYTKGGNAIMRVWQVSGGSVNGERSGWKLMRLDEATGAFVSDQPSEAPRRGYRWGDRDIAGIICEI
jgi:hypothetical protein